MIELILQLTDVLRDEPDGFELTVRELISRFFLMMRAETEDIRAAEKKGSIFPSTVLSLLSRRFMTAVSAGTTSQKLSR